MKTSKWPWGIPAAAVLIAGATFIRSRPAPTAQSAIRFQLHSPEGGRFASYSSALSPDGRTISFTATAQGKSGLWLHPLDGAAPRRLAGTEGAIVHIWSPNGRSIAYSTVSDLMRVEIDGGNPMKIYNGANNLGFWTNDGRIVMGGFGTADLRIVSASGGAPQPLTTLDSGRGEQRHSNPQPLPGGRLLFRVVAEKPENSGIFVTSFANPAERTRLLPASNSAFYAAGHLLWQKGSTLVAQPFDPDSLKLSGDPQNL